MLKPTSFSEILSELIEDNTSENNYYTSGWESHLDAHGMSQLYKHLQQSRFSVSINKAYPIRRAKPVVAPRTPHLFNEPQRQAYELLKTYRDDFSEGFTKRELKSVYRFAALKSHPDQGGCSETFQEVKKSYQILSALVKN